MLSWRSNGLQTAAWRVALWSTLAFGTGTSLVFYFLQANIQRSVAQWNQAWLVSENAAVTRILRQYDATHPEEGVARGLMELLMSQSGNSRQSNRLPLNTVFVMVKGPDGLERASAGLPNPAGFLQAVRRVAVRQSGPQSIDIPGADAPFRFLATPVGADTVYFGFSECISSHALASFKTLLLSSSLTMIVIGFSISFLSARRTLGRVQSMTDIASGIGQHNLSARVPVARHADEIGRLTRTFNGMLDRIESCVHQLHTMTDGLAHDLKGPITAMRAKLETALSEEANQPSEPLAYMLDELDRLTEFLNQYLDVAEARAGALRLCRRPIDLTALVAGMVELYQPSFVDNGLSIEMARTDAVAIYADLHLLQRMFANLLDNELKHIPRGCRVRVSVKEDGIQGAIVVEDDGPGFPFELRDQVFDRFAKGSLSAGRGLGLAFVQAVMSAHAGTARAGVSSAGGARLELCFAADENSICSQQTQLCAAPSAAFAH